LYFNRFDGVAIFINLESTLDFALIFQTVFIKCKSLSASGNGGAVFASINSFIFEKNCGFYCSAYKGQFFYFSQLNSFGYCSFQSNSISRCTDNLLSDHLATISFKCSCIGMSFINLTFNDCEGDYSILYSNLIYNFYLNYSNFINLTGVSQAYSMFLIIFNNTIETIFK
jgi:hypothetical protein